MGFNPFRAAREAILGLRNPESRSSKVDTTKEAIREQVLNTADGVRSEVDGTLKHPTERQLANQICSKLNASTKIKTLKVLHSLYRSENAPRIKDDTSEKTKEQVHAQIKKMAEKRGMVPSELEKAIHQQLWEEFQKERAAMKKNAEQIEPKKLSEAKRLHKNAELIVEQLRSGNDAKNVKQELIHQLSREFEPGYQGKNKPSKEVAEKTQRILYRLSQRTGLKRAVYELLGGAVGMLDGKQATKVEKKSLPRKKVQLKTPAFQKNRIQSNEVAGKLPESTVKNVRLENLTPVQKEMLRKQTQGLIEQLEEAVSVKTPIPPQKNRIQSNEVAGQLPGSTVKNVRLEDLTLAQKEELRKQSLGLIDELEEADFDQWADKKIEEAVSVKTPSPPPVQKRTQPSTDIKESRDTLDRLLSKKNPKKKQTKSTFERTGDARSDFILQSLDKKTGSYFKNLSELKTNLAKHPNTSNPYHLKNGLNKLFSMLAKAKQNNTGYQRASNALLEALVETKKVLDPVRKTEKFREFYEYIERKRRMLGNEHIQESRKAA